MIKKIFFGIKIIIILVLLFFIGEVIFLSIKYYKGKTKPEFGNSTQIQSLIKDQLKQFAQTTDLYKTCGIDYTKIPIQNQTTDSCINNGLCDFTYNDKNISIQINTDGDITIYTDCLTGKYITND